MREVYRYAIITGRAEYNPVPDLAIALAVPKQKHHPFLSAKELPHFIRDLEAYTGSSITKNATKIVTLTSRCALLHGMRLALRKVYGKYQQNG